MDTMDSLTFEWPDYLVFAIVLGMSAAIGFYYACSGGKQQTTKEYLLADKNMHWFPVASSLLARSVFNLSSPPLTTRSLLSRVIIASSAATSHLRLFSALQERSIPLALSTHTYVCLCQSP